MPDELRPGRRWIRQQPLIQGHQERGRLAGAGLGLSRDILAREGDRQGHCLNRGGPDEAGVADALGYGGNEIERSETQARKGVSLYLSLN